MGREVTSCKFLDMLEERGLIPPETQRVVIDAPYDGVLTIFVQHIAGSPLEDDEVLDVLMDAQVQIIGG